MSAAANVEATWGFSHGGGGGGGEATPACAHAASTLLGSLCTCTMNMPADL